MTQPDPVGRRTAYWQGRLSALMPMLLFVWFAFQVPYLADGGTYRYSVSWVPSLGVEWSFMLDGLSGLYGLIITGIGALVSVYADAYMAGHADIGRFFVLLHAFLLAMLGLVMSDNLFVLFVFWELTTLLSFVLIGFEHESASSRSSARQALLVTGGGGLLLLVGILLAGHAGGSYRLSDFSQSGDLLRNHRLYGPITLCMLVGAFTKSAQFPFHFWLPNAMAAPTPISTFLHSATMVKAGIYLLTRLHPVLGGTMLWMATLVFVGAATAVWGSVVALGQNDLKRLLAHTTIMALGIITMFLGGQTTPALIAAVTFLLVHALYKSALFMIVGSIDHQTGTRRLSKIGGLGRHMPFTTAATIMATLSMAGFPLFLGFIGKEIMYKGALTETVFPELATLAALSANALMTAVAATLALRPFWGRSRGHGFIQEAPWQMWIGPMVLSGIGLGFGLIPDWVSHWLIRPAVLAFHPTAERIRLEFFHGINAPLLLSVLTLCLGGLIYLGRRRFRKWVCTLINRLPLRMDRVYDDVLEALAWLAERQTRILQNGSLFHYLVVIVGTVVLLVGWSLGVSGMMPLQWQLPVLPAWQASLVLMMLVSVIVVVQATARLLAICALGVIGGGIAIIFLSHGAPDVALTQLLVETLTLIIAAIVLLRLPATVKIRRHSGRRRLSLLVSIAGGILVFALMLSVGRYEIDRRVTDFYEAASYVKAHGRNIVNVILVDFRSLDTLGEIIVVAASALAALRLIRNNRTET